MPGGDGERETKCVFPKFPKRPKRPQIQITSPRQKKKCKRVKKFGINTRIDQTSHFQRVPEVPWPVT